ncbi:MAG: hypothetical protein JNL64_04020 [Blastocatellia bacterium]|nr:hypothetical protein [Blastocatellia bacterium]
MSRNLKDKRPLLDTSVFIERDIPVATFRRMILSTVVLYELIAANIDDGNLELYLSWRRSFAKSKSLLSPTETDWIECSKLVRNLLRGAKSKTKGTVQKVTSAQQQQNDALIARTAAMHDCFVVTGNVRDFEKFQPYMTGLVVVSADYFFES